MADAASAAAGAAPAPGGVRAANPLAPGESNSQHRPGPPQGAIARARLNASRNETLKALHSGNLDMPDPAGGEATGDENADTGAPDEGDEIEDEDQGADTGDVEEQDEDEDEDEDDLDEPPRKPDPKKPTKPADKEEAKRQEQIRRKEEASRAAVREERRKLRDEQAAYQRQRDQDRAADAAERRELEAYRRAKANAKNDPLGVYRALGVSNPEDLGRAGQLLYAASKDPAAAERAIRESEQTSEVATLRQRLDELEGKAKESQEQAALQAAQATWIRHTVKAIKAPKTEAPLAKALLASDPAQLRRELWAETEALAEEYGGFDDIEITDVIAAYEKRKLAELRKLGVDITKFAKAAPAAADEKQKQNKTAADKKNPAKTLSPNLATPRVPRPEQSRAESRAETRRLLEAGQVGAE